MEKLTGIHAVREALTAGRALQTVIVGRDHHGGRLAEIVNLAKRNGVPLRFEDRTQLDRAAGTRDHQGVVALVAARSSVSLEDLLVRKSADAAPGLLVILDGVEDPQNLGAIIRTVRDERFGSLWSSLQEEWRAMKCGCDLWRDGLGERDELRTGGAD